MSGTVGDNIFRASGVIASAAAGGISWQSVETGSSFTAVAGNAYPVDTTSNTCTVTLPASAAVGDQMQFADYARNWGSNSVTLSLNGLNFQGATTAPVYETNGLNIILTYVDATKGWIPTLADVAIPVPATQKAIFALGADAGSPIYTSLSNLVSSSGVVASDTAEVAGVTKRDSCAAATYGSDKGITGYGTTGSVTGVTNLISNAGVIATDVAVVGTARQTPGCAAYGSDKAIFAYGYSSGSLSMSNLVSNTGVVGADVSGVGTARLGPSGVGYSTDLAIFAFGAEAPSYVAMSNLVTNQGVIGTDVSAVASAKGYTAATKYGNTKAVYAYGYNHTVSPDYLSFSNLVSTYGVISADITGVGTARNTLSAAGYGGDKGIFGFGTVSGGTRTAITNLVTNVGVVGTDVAGVGTARYGSGCCGYSSTG